MKRFAVVCLIIATLPLKGVADPGYTKTDAMVAMSDGVNLDASVYIPTGSAPAGGFPLIVRQHGGGSNKESPYDVAYGLKFVETGNYALLMYSHRGHGNSGGFFDFFGARTTRDFSDMLDWVAASFPGRVNANRVAASGYSQGGGESLLPAEADPRVKVVAVGNTFANLNRALNPNDCMKFSFATAIFVAAYKAAAARTDDATAIRWGATLYTDTEDVSTPATASTTQELDGRSPTAGINALIARRVPVFWTQSWEDQLFPGDHPEVILRPLEKSGVPVHYWFSSGGHAAGPNFPADEVAKEAAMRDWIDEFLRGVHHGYASGAKPKVDYWERTAPGLPGTWVQKTAKAWPPRAATTASLYAGPGTTLANTQPSPGTAGTIVNDLVSANLGHDSIAANELPGRAPVPQLGDVVRSVPESPNPLDAVTFTSEPLISGFQSVGAPIIEADVGTTARRVVQLNAKVWDVAPDGSAMLVNRLCFSTVDPQPIQHVRFALWPNAHTYAQGHRVALTLSAVDFPTFKPDTEPAVTTILVGTRLLLPVQR